MAPSTSLSSSGPKSETALTASLFLARHPSSFMPLKVGSKYWAVTANQTSDTNCWFSVNAAHACDDDTIGVKMIEAPSIAPTTPLFAAVSKQAMAAGNREFLLFSPSRNSLSLDREHTGATISFLRAFLVGKSGTNAEQQSDERNRCAPRTNIDKARRFVMLRVVA